MLSRVRAQLSAIDNETVAEESDLKVAVFFFKLGLCFFLVPISRKRGLFRHTLGFEIGGFTLWPC